MSKGYDNYDETELIIELNSGLNNSQMSIQENQERLAALSEKLVNRVKKVEADVDNVKTMAEDNTKELRKTNILASPTYAKPRRALGRICRSRVHKILGESTGCTYVTLNPYFFKGIYSDIAKTYKLASWDSMSMADYGEPNCLYEQVWEYAQNWRPTKDYVDYCIGELVEKRDNGYLPQNRCRALTDFLSVTNNCNNLPW